MLKSFILFLCVTLFSFCYSAELNFEDINPFPNDSNFDYGKVNSYGNRVRGDVLDKFIKNYEPIKEKWEEAEKIACGEDKECSKNLKVILRKKTIELEAGNYEYYTFIVNNEKTSSSAMFVFHVAEDEVSFSKIITGHG